MLAKYSGKLSKPFWNAVGRIENEVDHDVVYTLGVALQNLEGQTLHVLKAAQKKTKREGNPNG